MIFTGDWNFHAQILKICKIHRKLRIEQDLVRRLLNTKEELPPCYRAQVIDDYGAKLRTSGYNMEVTRKILCNGMKGYAMKVQRRRLMGSRIHRTAQESSSDRWRKKMLGKTNWFREKCRDKASEKGAFKPGTGGTVTHSPLSRNLRVRAAIFVEQSPRGELASILRQQLQKIEGLMGYRL